MILCKKFLLLLFGVCLLVSCLYSEVRGENSPLVYEIINDLKKEVKVDVYYRERLKEGVCVFNSKLNKFELTYVTSPKYLCTANISPCKIYQFRYDFPEKLDSVECRIQCWGWYYKFPVKPLELSIKTSMIKSVKRKIGYYKFPI